MNPKFKEFLLRWVSNVLGLSLAAYWVTGIHFYKLADLVMATVFLTVLHVFVRPGLKIFLQLLIVMTLGFLNFVINAALLYFVGRILVPNFEVATFGAAFWGGLIISAVSGVIFVFLKVVFGVTVLRAAIRPAAPRPRNVPTGPPPGTGPVIDI
jgi:putative membrane protein